MSSETAARRADLGQTFELFAAGETQDLALLADLGLTFELANVSAGITVAVGQVTETDTAQAVAWAPKRRLVAQASETDAAQALTARKTAAVAQAALGLLESRAEAAACRHVPEQPAGAPASVISWKQSSDD